MPEHIKPMGFIVARVIPSAVLFFVVSWFLPKENIEKINGRLYGVGCLE